MFNGGGAKALICWIGLDVKLLLEKSPLPLKWKLDLMVHFGMCSVGNAIENFIIVAR